MIYILCFMIVRSSVCVLENLQSCGVVRHQNSFSIERPAFDTVPVDLVSGFQIWFSQMKWNFSGIVSGVEPDEGTLVV